MAVRATRPLLRVPAESLRIPCMVPPRNADLVLPHTQKFPEVKLTTLPNGFRVASADFGGETATVSIFIDAGSRFETPQNNGAAHFLEHMTFKGTKLLSQKNLEKYFEFSGGKLNAYTTREQTIYFAKVFKDKVTPAVSVLTDILRNPRLDYIDIENERSTIIQEMNDVESNIDEVMLDHLHLTAFPKDGLGLTILGPEENIVKHINKEMMQEFVRQHYTAKRMVLVGAGAVDHAELESLATKLWGDLSPDPVKPILDAKFHGGSKVVANHTIPAPHICVSWPICPQSDSDFLTCLLMQFIIGRWDRSMHYQGGYPVDTSVAARKFIEKNCSRPDAAGNLESLQAFSTPYSDVSLLGIYMVASPGEQGTDAFTDFCSEGIEMCLEDIRNITRERLQVIKNYMKTEQLLHLDGSTAVQEEMGRQILAHSRTIPLDEIIARIDAIELEDVQEAFDKYIARNRDFVLVGVGKPLEIPSKEKLEARIWRDKGSLFQKEAHCVSA